MKNTYMMKPINNLRMTTLLVLLLVGWMGADAQSWDPSHTTGTYTLDDDFTLTDPVVLTGDLIINAGNSAHTISRGWTDYCADDTDPDTQYETTTKGMFVVNGYKLTITGESDKKITLDGGAVYRTAGDARSGFKSGYKGRIIWVGEDGRIELTHVNLQNAYCNTALSYPFYEGGGILFHQIGDNAKTSMLTDVRFTGCHANQGSAIKFSNADYTHATFTRVSVSLCKTDVLTGAPDNAGGTIRTNGACRSRLTMNNCEIFNNESANGAGILWNAGSAEDALLTIKGNTEIHDNKAISGNGGGIFVTSAIDLQSVEIYNNTANNGAGIFCGTYGGKGNEYSGEGFSVEIASGICIHNNTATQRGGGLYMYFHASDDVGFKANGTPFSPTFSFNMTGGEIRNNKARDGAGVAILDQAPNRHKNNSPNLIGGEGANPAYGHWSGEYKRMVNITGGSIHDNEGGSGNTKGGGLFVLKTKDTDITNGSIGYTYGTAISEDENVTAGTITIKPSGGSIYGNNVHHGDGGGIYITDEMQNVSPYFSVCKVEVDAVSIYGNSCEVDGAGLCVRNGIVTVKDSRIGVKPDGTASANVSGRNGGGLYVDNAQDVATTFTGSTKLSNNTAARHGGGAYVNNGIVSIEGSTAEIKNNRATSNGGGIYMYNGRVTISGGNIGGSGTANTAVNGGGLYVRRGSIGFSNGTISHNTASTNGGGFYVEGGTVVVEGGTIKKNTASNSGGGFYATGGTVTITGGTIGGSGNGNTAVNGGGLYVADGTVTCSEGTVSHNTASSNGGGFYVYRGSLVVKSGNISHNQANGSGESEGNGGGFYSVGGTVEVQGGTIMENTAQANGGGFYVRLDNGSLKVNSTVDNTSVDHNHAVDGAGFYVIKGNVTIADASNDENTTTIGGNIATGTGGGLFCAGGSVTITGGTIGGSGNGNTAVKGGGIYVAEGSITYNDGIVSHNTATAGSGGGIYVDGGTISYNNGTVKLNTATANGGGIYLAGGQISLTGGTIGGSGSGNSAVNGGGIFVDGGSINFSGGAVSYNTASGNGGGIYANAEGFTFSDGTIGYNYAAGDGGGAYIPEGTSITLSGQATVTGNHVPASGLGGGIYMNGNLYVGGGSTPWIKCKDNYVGTAFSLETRHNIYLPWRTKYVTLLSDISSKDANGIYNTQIGITVNPVIADFNLPVVYVDNEGNEPWLYNLMADVATAGAAVFDDTQRYTAIHTRRNVSVYSKQYIYFAMCWANVVTSNPGEEHIKLIGDTYHIYTNQGLAWFCSLVNGLNHRDGDATSNPNADPQTGLKAKLEADIDMGRHLWVPLGAITGYVPGPSNTSYFLEDATQGYTGEFNGQGYVISGITNGYLTGIYYYGLFGVVNTGGIVKNTLMDSYANLLVNSEVYSMGGIAGACSGGTIYNCEARGGMDLTGSAATSCAGGIVGRLNSGEVHSCMAIPVLEGTNTLIGGLVGYVVAGASLKNSFANSWIVNSGGCQKGGIVGVNDGTVENCYVRIRRPVPDGYYNFAWFTGNHGSGVLRNCYAPENIPNFSYGYGLGYSLGHGSYDTTALINTKYGFAHSDQQITLAPEQTNSSLVNGAITNDGNLGGLQATLNKWVTEHNQELGDDDIKYTLWTRTLGSGINEDYPILQLGEKNESEKFSCVGSKDGLC